jgi:hypothetical protein
MNTTIIPVQFILAQGKKIEIVPDQVEEIAFADVTVKDGSTDARITETELEEFVRKNIQTIFPQETLLIVGQQVINKEGGRADLVAIDDTGSIALIELKRDAGDIAARKEALEFQAIRYAANYALIAKPSDLAQKLFAPYVDKHRSEYGKKELTANQLASEILEDFLRTNKIKDNEFNQSQRIVLIASSFDDQTLSACAWLSKNGIDLKCLTISPVKYGEGYFLVIEQIIPPASLDEFFVEVAEPSQGQKKAVVSKQRITRENLPRMPKLFEWEIIKPGDKIYIQGHRSEEAEVIDQRNVIYKGETMSYNDWGQQITGWSAINIYEWSYLASSDRSLDDLRREKMEVLAPQPIEHESRMLPNETVEKVNLPKQ